MPVELITLLTFVPAALALNLTPGADMMFCLGLGLRAGPGPAVAASAGISAGSLVHVLLAGLGLGAVLAAWPGAFDTIRWIGVAYLLWLAGRTLCTPLGASGVTGSGSGKAFRDGLVVNLTNPKVILFVLAFLPQFTDPARGAILLQFLILGAVLALGGFVINGLVGAFAAGLGYRLLSSARVDRALRIVSASIFGLLALRLATDR